VIATERQASILAPEGFGDREASNQLRALLELTEAVAADPPDEATVIAAAERFAGGEDAMKVHRQLFAASLLLDRRVAVSKAGELAAAATGMTDTALSVANPSAAVLASELYEARRAAALKNEFLIVPTVPKQTLSAIFRGRVEELAARAFVETGDLEAAQIRFRRAISVLPEKSSWWRSSKWRLGDVLAAEGKESEALEQYIDAYDQEKPDRFRYISIAALYSKVNGGIEGLEERIGPNPAPQIVEVANEPEKDDVPADVPGSDPPEERVGEIATPVEATVETIPPPEDATVKAAGSENETPQTENDKAATEPKVADEAADKVANEGTPTLTLKRVADTDTDKREEDVVADPSDTADVKAENENKNPPAAGEKQADATPARSLFEPIVITIPSSRRAATTRPAVQPPVSGDAETDDEPLPTEALTSSENNAEPADDPDQKKPPATGISETLEEQDDTDRPEAEIESGNEIPTEADAAGTDLSGAVRPRLVAGKAVSANVPVCQIKVSQETVSIINGGGNLGLLVSIEGEGDIRSVQATASSPDDISIVPEPAMIGIPGRAFFVIRSKSTNTGTYRVTFGAPCGTKDVAVEVR
jgi:tetratricopeptide (TPR) repeat protein